MSTSLKKGCNKASFALILLLGSNSNILLNKSDATSDTPGIS